MNPDFVIGYLLGVVVGAILTLGILILMGQI